MSLAGPTDFAFVQETGVKRRRLSLPGHRPQRLRKRKDSKPLPPRKRPRAFSATANILSLSEPSAELADSELELVLSSPQPVATSSRHGCLNPRLEFPDLYRLSPRVSEVLDFYRWRFSFVTLTFKVQINPWHMCLPMAFDNPCLMDAIVALSRRYRAHLLDQPESLEVMHLKNRALSAFSSVLHSAHPATLVGTILTLIGLDYVETAYSNWPVHFRGAYSVIQAGGGIEIAQYNPPLQTQIAQLAWYDTTSALISRRNPIFPRKWIEELMAWRSISGWNLLALNGCPDDLFLQVYDMAEAASRNVQGSEAAALERNLWTVVLDPRDGGIAALFDCWRLGLLLYCTRVFGVNASSPAEDTQQGQSAGSSFGLGLPLGGRPAVEPSQLPSTSIMRCRFLAEEILWLVMDIPPESNLQKQCLIPLIFAACELDDDPEQLPFRIMAENYCRRWRRLSGLRLFDDALGLMQATWTLMEVTGDPNVWWGNVFTASQPAQSNLQLQEAGSAMDELDLGKEWMFG
ncbi:Fungal specific transcription factor domain-containing protein [Cladophialophora immunda]|nr:Fungal specific transcription factor domain-containing protein [Cladophialophora immunda]